MELLSPRKAEAGDKVAVLSTSFAAPAVAPAVHEQAMDRLRVITGLVPVEFPTTRKLDASPRERADDLNAAFADPEIRAVLATIGGEDQITVVPHLDASLVAADPKPFLGYSDNTNLLNWLWTNGVAGYYGGSTQVQLGPGPRVDPIHELSLRAALLTGDRVELTEPGESEDIGRRLGRPASADRVRRARANRTLDLVGTSAISHGPDLGRLHRSCPVDPDRWSVSGRPCCPRWRSAAPRVLRGPDPRSRVRPDHQIARGARHPGGRGRRRRRAASDIGLCDPADGRREAGKA